VFILPIIYFKLLTPGDLDIISPTGLQDFFSARPIYMFFITFVWIFVAIIIAVVFGVYWDPLDYICSHLVRTTGGTDIDQWHILLKYTRRKREQNPSFQLWIQAR
jgi:hypothetical protein